MFQERRGFPRANFNCTITVSFAERLLVFRAQTENISASGLRFALDEKLAKHTLVDLELFLLNNHAPIKCKGEIVWAKERLPGDGTQRLFDTGIQFTELNESDRYRIQELVNRLIIEQGHA